MYDENPRFRLLKQGLCNKCYDTFITCFLPRWLHGIHPYRTTISSAVHQALLPPVTAEWLASNRHCKKTDKCQKKITNNQYHNQEQITTKRIALLNGLKKNTINKPRVTLQIILLIRYLNGKNFDHLLIVPFSLSQELMVLFLSRSFCVVDPNMWNKVPA